MNIGLGHLYIKLELFLVFQHISDPCITRCKVPIPRAREYYMHAPLLEEVAFVQIQSCTPCLQYWETWGWESAVAQRWAQLASSSTWKIFTAHRYEFLPDADLPAWTVVR